jgi:hypothetical protein
MQADEFRVAKEFSRNFAQITLALAMFQEEVDRIASQWPERNPFDGFSVEDLTKTPDYLLGKETAFGWPLVQGHILAAAERDLGYSQPVGRIDRRTWAAMGGIAFIQAVDLFPVDYSVKVDYAAFDEDEEFAARTKALIAFATNERSFVHGYLDARNLPGRGP